MIAGLAQHQGRENSQSQGSLWIGDLAAICYEKERTQHGDATENDEEGSKAFCPPHPIEWSHAEEREDCFVTNRTEVPPRNVWYERFAPQVRIQPGDVEDLVFTETQMDLPPDHAESDPDQHNGKYRGSDSRADSINQTVQTGS